MKADHNGHGRGIGGGRQTGASEASRVKSIEANYEVSDVELRGIIVFLIGLTVMTVVVYLLMFLMFTLLNTREVQTENKQQSPLALSEKERLPPEPRLQSAPGFAEQLGKEVGVKEGGTSADTRTPKDRTWELDQLQEKWAEELKDGPKDQNGNPVGISIAEAEKQIISGNRLPARSTTTAAEQAENYAIDMPTAASSGRMSEKRKQ
jgi:hypothetical protein